MCAIACQHVAQRFDKPTGIARIANGRTHTVTFVPQACAGCGGVLFDTAAKFESGTGWPSFWRSARDGAVSYNREGDGRIEVHCDACRGHLGHVFLANGPLVEETGDAPVPPSDIEVRYGRRPRYCINGAALRFRARDEC